MPKIVDPAVVLNTLNKLSIDYEVLTCDPALADTDIFCTHYGYSKSSSANTILVTSKTGRQQFAACVILASTRLDVNKTVRKRMAVRKVSFASAEQAELLTGMTLGGVTPIGLPDTLAVWVDHRVMLEPSVILGGGDRSTKIKVSPELFPRMPNVTIVEGLAVNE